MTNDTAIQILIGYLNDSCSPNVHWPKDMFEEVCYSRWAAGELVRAILDRPLVPAKDTIEEFAVAMSFFAFCADEEDAEQIFSIAADFACEILTLF